MDHRASTNSKWFLLEAGYRPNTVRRYKTAVASFLEWCCNGGLIAHSFEDLDDHLTNYFHYLFGRANGGGRQLATETYFGVVMLLPRADGQLRVSHRALERWRKFKPSVSYPPLTWVLTVAIAIQMARSGLYRFAIATLLGFDCLLRCGELLSLRRSDVADAGDSRLGAELRVMSVAIRRAKTGRNQSVTVLDEDVKALLRSLLASTSDSELLFPGGVKLYRLVFKMACHSLGLRDGYVPHSLRHGGATRLWMLGWSIEDIMVRGCWASTKSARHYVQEGRAVLMSLRRYDSLVNHASVLASRLQRAFALAQKH
jgi:integrase